MTRIIGQCDTADFRSIEHLAIALEDPAMLDQSTLKRKQKLAFMVLAAALDAGINYKELFKIKTILFRDDGTVDCRFLSADGIKDLKENLRRAFQKLPRQKDRKTE